MRLLAAIFAASVLLGSQCYAEISWTYHGKVHGVDGWSAPYVTTTIDGKEIKYVPPVHWSLSGSKFIPPDTTEADAYIDALSIAGPSPWTAERAKVVHDMVMSRLIPGNATDGVIISEGTIAAISGQPAYEVCYSYNRYGQAFSDSIVFVEFGKIQIQCHLGCLKSDFAALHSLFLGSLHTLGGF